MDEGTFDAVQRKLGERVRPPRSKAGTALLAGLVRCPSCGHRMSRSGGGNGSRYYTCRKRHSGVICPAPAGINAGLLERHVEAIALAELERLQVEASADTAVADAQAQVEEAQRKLTKYVEAIEPEDVGPEAFAAGARKRREAVDKAKDTLGAAMARQPASPVVGSGVDVWGELSDQERNTLLRGLLAAVLVQPAGRGRKVPIADRVRVLAYGTELPPGRDATARPTAFFRFRGPTLTA